jgi:peroxiredoxin
MTKYSTRALRLSIVLAFALSLITCQNKAAKVVLNAGDKAPLFSLKDMNGKNWSLDELKGKVVLVNFWASWCPPCRVEMPSMQNLLLKMKNNKDFIILTILYSDDPTTALKYMKENKLTLTVLLNKSLTVSKMFGVTGVPETYIIDKKGILRRKIIGPINFDTPDTLAFLSSLTRESAE